MSAVWRVVRVVGIGALVLVAVVGSIWLSQADVLMTIRAPDELLTLATPTLFPTLPPTTPTATPQPPPLTADRPQATPTEALETQMPSVTPTATTTPEPVACVVPEGWIAYTVQEGDTLQSLARSSGTNLQGLLQGNCLSEAGVLVEGMLLQLPAVARATPIPAIVCGPPPGWPLITVQPRETLYALSVRYGVTVNALKNANCLAGDLIKAGDRLYVPRRIVVLPTVPPTIIWWTPVPPVSDTPTTTPSPTVTEPPTPTPTATLTPSPTPTPTETPVLIPTWTPWASPTPGTLDPVDTPTAPPPSATATEQPAATPTPEENP